MAMIESLLDYLCCNRFERGVASAILAAGDHQGREFWLDVHTRLVDSSSCIDFSYYPSIARCHVLCIATAPECSHTWASIVLEELTRRVADRASLDAFVMGSQLGLFQAGKWLQEKRQALIGQNFLTVVARYCAALFGKECLPVNISNYDSEISRAQQELDRAVKDYLRPQNSNLAEQIRLEIREMLVELQRVQFAEDRFSARRGCRADRWLLDALLHGSLDVANRTRNELIQATLAIST